MYRHQSHSLSFHLHFTMQFTVSLSAQFTISLTTNAQFESEPFQTCWPLLSYSIIFCCTAMHSKYMDIKLNQNYTVTPLLFVRSPKPFHSFILCRLLFPQVGGANYIQGDISVGILLQSCQHVSTITFFSCF